MFPLYRICSLLYLKIPALWGSRLDQCRVWPRAPCATTTQSRETHTSALVGQWAASARNGFSFFQKKKLLAKELPQRTHKGSISWEHILYRENTSAHTDKGAQFRVWSIYVIRLGRREPTYRRDKKTIVCAQVATFICYSTHTQTHTSCHLQPCIQVFTC